MASLKNPKYEKFALSFIEQDGNPKKTMEASGYKWNPSYFSQLKNRPKIQERITELQKASISKKVLSLTERLEILSDFARDPQLPKRDRINALKELHRQSGDDVQKVNMDVTAETQNVIKFVEIHMPTVNKDNKDVEFTGDELDSLDEFLKKE